MATTPGMTGLRLISWNDKSDELRDDAIHRVQRRRARSRLDAAKIVPRADDKEDRCRYQTDFAVQGCRKILEVVAPGIVELSREVSAEKNDAP